MRAAFFFFTACLILVPTSAQADPKGDVVMRRYDRKTNAFKDITLRWNLTVKHPGRKASLVKFKVVTRPQGQRLIQMQYPGDIKGMHILVQSADEMYIYLPAFRKVRRIAGHVRNQGFQGSGFTYDDMAIGKWAPYYDSTILREDGKHWWLDSRAKAGKTPPYPHVQMSIRKDIDLVHEIQYLDRHGKKYKSQLFLDYRCRGDNTHCNPTRIQMIEHTRGNLVSEMNLRGGILYDKGYDDDIFTVRYLHKSAD
ncbi:MAG: outer membrane lipoprotein-sorting protein [Polyangia bacterium]|nr:outer membrane lipoprotein-sorting protein [Polyangia bacterium]